MASLHIKLWDRLFLKTTFFALFLLAVIYLVDGKWGLSIFLILVAIFGLGGIGQALYPNISTKELASGGMTVRPNDYKSLYLDSDDANAIVKATCRLSLLLLIVVGVIMHFNSHSLLKTLLYAVAAGVAVPVLTVTYAVIFGCINHWRRK